MGGQGETLLPCADSTLASVEQARAHLLREILRADQVVCDFEALEEGEVSVLLVEHARRGSHAVIVFRVAMAVVQEIFARRQPAQATVRLLGTGQIRRLRLTCEWIVSQLAGSLNLKGKDSLVRGFELRKSLRNRILVEGSFAHFQLIVELQTSEPDFVVLEPRPRAIRRRINSGGCVL